MTRFILPSIVVTTHIYNPRINRVMWILWWYLQVRWDSVQCNSRLFSYHVSKEERFQYPYLPSLPDMNLAPGIPSYGGPAEVGSDDHICPWSRSKGGAGLPNEVFSKDRPVSLAQLRVLEICPALFSKQWDPKFEHRSSILTYSDWTEQSVQEMQQVSRDFSMKCYAYNCFPLSWFEGSANVHTYLSWYRI